MFSPPPPKKKKKIYFVQPYIRKVRFIGRIFKAKRVAELHLVLLLCLCHRCLGLGNGFAAPGSWRKFVVLVSAPTQLLLMRAQTIF